MEKINVLMIFDQRHSIMRNVADSLVLFDIDVTVVHTLREGLDLQHGFDLLFVDIDFPLMDDGKTRIPIFDEGERIEQLFGRSYPVFNFLKKVTTRIILYDNWSEVVVNTKLDQLALKQSVTYLQSPLLVRDIIIVIKKFLTTPVSV